MIALLRFRLRRYGLAMVSRVVLLLGAAGFVLSACSNTQAPAASGPHDGTSTASTVAGVQTVTLEAGSDYRFHPSTIVVHPGRVKVILKNTARSGAPHNFTVTQFPADFVPAAGAGTTQEATFVAPAPGRYQFVCTFHVEQGQTGTLVVTP